MLVTFRQQSTHSLFAPTQLGQFLTTESTGGALDENEPLWRRDEYVLPFANPLPAIKMNGGEAKKPGKGAHA